jgi:tetratricopeptide (TPR) repeat protein
MIQHQSVRVTDKPTVSIEMASDGPEDARASALRDSLMIALSRFNTLRLSADAYAAGTEGSARPDGRAGSGYQILLKYKTEAHSRSVWWQVVDHDSGEAVRTGEESTPIDNLSPGEVDERLASKLAVQLASMRGVINSMETARDFDSPSLGNGCVLRADLALTASNPESLTSARNCLERTLKRRPYDADAHAMLSAVLLASDPDRRSEKLAELAGDHADKAVALAPESDRSYMAQMMAAFRAGLLEKAKQAGSRAIALNPDNPAVAAKYSSILFAMGDWKNAVPLARQASLINDTPQPDAERTLAFDAYRRGAYDEAALRLQRLAGSRCPLTQLLLAASLAQAGDEREATEMLTAIKGERPDFEETFQADMASRRLTPVLVDALGEGLRRAGSSVQ